MNAEPKDNPTAAGIYTALSALADRLARRRAEDAECLNDNDVNRVMAEHLRHAIEEIEIHPALDALATDAVPDIDGLRAARQALERFARAKIELTDLLEVTDNSLYGNRPCDLSPLFYRVSRHDLAEIQTIADTIDTVCGTAECNLARQEEAFRKQLSRRGLHIVP